MAGLEVDCILPPCGLSLLHLSSLRLLLSMQCLGPQPKPADLISGHWAWELAGSVDFPGDSLTLRCLWVRALGSIKMDLPGLESEKILGHILGHDKGKRTAK